ncbi:hypothetical protein GCM10010387_44430 [Streptomyces inusitatus]|uniref:Uncharacterized protein n=2 Tax=Streptomyces inusitatus TaxID=68221 RepID=A0A918QGY4_9ACTN|nr:hypothetical protein GCM10010387_44430 [Streptomyces inusitatus]
MSSSDITSAVPSWHFLMHPQAPLTVEQNDVMDTHDSFADGFVGREEILGVETTFICYFEANNLMDAMKQALARIEHIPGVLIESIELNPHSFEHNGMQTASVVRNPD